MTGKSARPTQPRLWGRLTFAGAAISLAASPVLGQGQWPVPSASRPGQATLWLAQAQGGEGGEGGTATPAPGGLTDDMALLALAKMHAHLTLAAAHYAAGDHAAAETLAEGVADTEIAAIAPELVEHEAPNFHGKVQALETAIEAKADAAKIADAVSEAQNGILAAQGSMISGSAMPFVTIKALLAEAGEDYAKGVKDGALAEAGEYRDAMAYVGAARAMAEIQAASDDAAVQSVARAALAAIGETDSAFNGFAPVGQLAGDPMVFAAAAAKVELAAYKLSKG